MCESHYKIIELYRLYFPNKKQIDEQDLLKIFPGRKLFCQCLFKWMCILSYRKTANRESFLYAIEIFILDSSLLIKESYVNHSYSFIDIFMIMTLCIRPSELHKIT